MPTHPKVKKSAPDKEKGAGNSIFPLDIRRCPAAYRYKQLSVNQRGEEIVHLKGSEALREYRKMPQDDPWWVTPEQEICRDVPPRRWPIAKGHDREGELLPYDNLDWKDHQERDKNEEYLYFATNLDGRSVLINGVEVEKGAIVGPLPEFAIIETPGGQVSFWHGLKQKSKRQVDITNTERLPPNEEQRQWSILRQQKGWEQAGMRPGEVWMGRIKNRLQREEAGAEGEEDDDIWKAWREWKEPDTSLPPLAYQTIGMCTSNRVFLREFS